MATIKNTETSGHRNRLRARILMGAAETMADYELLEFLLTSAIPRRDVKPIAKELIRKFGSFAEVIYAPENKLAEIPWVKENAIALFKGIGAAVQRVCWQNLAADDAPILANIDTLIDYFRASFAYAEVEELHIVYLDAAFKLLGTDLLQRGSLTGVVFSPREIIKQAINKKASSIILAHNHPSGKVTPSKNDIEFTKKIEDACNTMNIALQEHIIISKNDYFSFREKGIICF